MNLVESNLNSYINDFTLNESTLNTSTSTQATSTLCSLTNIQKTDQTQLLINKIKYLEEELSNAQADKEFVWSLWKQLQSTNPDVTSAISQVVQREKEKSEIKDRKVLEILKIKDKKLEENEKLISTLNEDVGKLEDRLRNFELELVQKNEETELLKKNAQTSGDKEQMYEQIIRLRDDKMEKIVKENEQEKIYLINKVADLNEENENLKSELVKKRSELETRNLELKTVNENYEKLLGELNQFRESIDQCLRQENEKLRAEVSKKGDELDKVKGEYDQIVSKFNSNLDCLNQQDKLIKQLKQIQTDQQNTIGTQKANYEVLDSENFTLKKMYDDLLRKFESFLQGDKTNKLIEEVERLEAKDKVNKDLVKTKTNEIEKLKMEVDLFKEKLGYAESIVSELNRKCEILTEENEWRRREVKPKTRQPRSKSQNSKNESEDSELKRYYENICQLKDKELVTLKNSHQRRLEKLLSLDKENQLLKKQLELNDSDETERPVLKDPKAKGYKRLDCQVLTKELTNLRRDNDELEKENFRLKETLDEMKFKLDQQNEQIQAINFELNFNFKDKEKYLQNKHDLYEKNLSEKREKCLKLESEVTNLKHLCKDLDAKCTSLGLDREKYLSLSNKLMNENKRMYKKWFDLRKKENKFKLMLSQQIRKYSQKTTNEKKDERENEQISKKTIKQDEKKTISIQLKSKNLKLQLAKKQTDELIKQKNQLDLKLKNFKDQNEKLLKEIECLDTKLKNSKLQIENLNNEITSHKKREYDLKETEINNIKKEQQSKDDLKKQLDSKIRQLNNELTRQLTQNKTLKTENDKLTDRIKVNDEKMNHLERDNNQKKQLVDFYKKKLEENNLKTDPIVNYANEQILTELKQQVKRLSELVEKYKVETKNLRVNLERVQNEKSILEEKCDKLDKANSNSKEKMVLLKKQKSELENQLSNEHKRVLNLEELVNELESTAQNNLKTLSQASHETLNLAQVRVKYAFKLVENFENLIKNLYESLINRVNLNRKMIQMYKNKIKEDSKTDMKFALDLASSVLNMSHNELDDLLTGDDKNDGNGDKLMFEFEQFLNTSKKEVQEMSDDFNVVNIEKVCQLITNKLDEILSLEKELTQIKQN